MFLLKNSPHLITVHLRPYVVKKSTFHMNIMAEQSSLLVTDSCMHPLRNAAMYSLPCILLTPSLLTQNTQVSHREQFHTVKA